MIFRASAPCASPARPVARAFLLLLTALAVAFPQRLSFGLRAGVPFNDLLRSESWSGVRYQPESGRYALGPAVELLAGRFSVGLDLFYRPLKYRSEFAGASHEATGSAWQFPLMGKVRLSGGLVAPFVGAGLAFNRFSGLKDLPSSYDAPSTGWVFGFGLEGRLPVVRISPELRYTHWRVDDAGQPASVLRVSRRSQLEALVGITF